MLVDLGVAPRGVTALDAVEHEAGVLQHPLRAEVVGDGAAPERALGRSRDHRAQRGRRDAAPPQLAHDPVADLALAVHQEAERVPGEPAVGLDDPGGVSGSARMRAQWASNAARSPGSRGRNAIMSEPATSDSSSKSVLEVVVDDRAQAHVVALVDGHEP